MTHTIQQQALQLTVEDLTEALTKEMITKNTLAVQLTEANQQIETLRQENQQLMAELDKMTAPESDYIEAGGDN